MNVFLLIVLIVSIAACVSFLRTFEVFEG